MDVSVFNNREMAEFRKLAEAWMTYTCVIRRPSTKGALNENTGSIDFVDGALVYSGKCRLTVSSQGVMNVGEQTFYTRYTSLYIPHDAAVPRTDDEVVVSVGGFGTDDRKFRITQVVFKTWMPSIEMNVTQIEPSKEAGSF